jgi:eukaryotic-like serine/threonine-protein kinase
MSERVTVAAGPDGRPVARKVGPPPHRADLLRHEAAVLALARHPGVVDVVDLDEDDGGMVTLTTAWAGGRRLADVGRLPAEEAAGLAAALATTVADVHDLGLVHGRVEPGHVLVAEGGRPVLCGWSGAGRAGDVPHPGAAPPATQDPANPWGSPLVSAADVHGLGVVLDALLGADDGAEPIPDRRIGRRRSAWRGYHRRTLQTLADQATADDPAHRPTARGLASALQAAVPEARLPAADRVATGTLVDGLAPPRRPVIVATRATDLTTETAASPPGAAWPGEAPAAPPAPAPGTPPPSVPVAPAAAGAPGPLLTVPPLSGRAVAAAAAAVVGIALLAGGGRILAGGPPPDPTIGTATVPTTTVAAAAPCDGSGGQGLVADVDGDGCAEPVRMGGERVVEVADVRFAVGQPGDRVLVGDWDCDGQATPAVVRPATGELFVFAGWAPDGEELTVPPVATVPRGATAEAVDADRDGCTSIVATAGGGAGVTWPEGER